jgi:hypothetical protein
MTSSREVADDDGAGKPQVSKFSFTDENASPHVKVSRACGSTGGGGLAKASQITLRSHGFTAGPARSAVAGRLGRLAAYPWRAQALGNLRVTSRDTELSRDDLTLLDLAVSHQSFVCEAFHGDVVCSREAATSVIRDAADQRGGTVQVSAWIRVRLASGFHASVPRCAAP